MVEGDEDEEELQMKRHAEAMLQREFEKDLQPALLPFMGLPADIRDLLVEELAAREMLTAPLGRIFDLTIEEFAERQPWRPAHRGAEAEGAGMV